jgi:hypothetical protein
MRIKICLYFLMMSLFVHAQVPSLQWGSRIGNPLDEDSQSIAVDASGNIFTTGFFSGTNDFDPGPGMFNMTAIGDHDMFVLKLDASGNFLWAIHAGGNKSIYSDYVGFFQTYYLSLITN